MSAPPFQQGAEARGEGARGRKGREEEKEEEGREEEGVQNCLQRPERSEGA